MVAMAAEELLGREDELAAVEAFLEGGRTGASVLVFEGEPGVGKTALWREAVRRAKSSEFLVLSCRPAEAEAKLSYSALADLLEPLGAEVFATLPDPQRHALGVALLRVSEEGSPAQPRAIAAGLRRVLESLADRLPVLVAIDDTQWLDVASARALEFALRRSESSRVCLLATRRAGAAAGRTRLGLVEAETLELDGLSLAVIHELLKRRLGRSLPRPLLVRLYEACGGNPFYALEIARQLPAAERAPTDPLPLSDDLQRLLRWRLDRLSAHTKEVLLVIASTAAPTRSLLHQVLGTDPSPALEEAEQATLIERRGSEIRFSHPLYATAISAATPQERRRRLHVRLGELATNLEERARHRALASDGPDAKVADALEEAALQARRRGAWEAAADLSELGALLTPVDRSEDGWRRALLVAEYHRDVGDYATARSRLEQVLRAEPPPEIGSRAHHLLGLATWFSGHCEDAIELLKSAKEEASDDFARATIARDLGMLLAANWDVRRARRHVREAHELSERLAEPTLLARTLPAVALADFIGGRGVNFELLERARALEQFVDTERTALRATYWLAKILRDIGELDAARPLFDDLLRRVQEVGDAHYEPEFSCDLALLEIWAGNYERAANFAATAVAGAHLLESEILDPALATQALVKAHCGDIHEARRALEQAVGNEELPVDAAEIAGSAAFIATSAGEPDAALAAVDGLYDRLHAAGVREPALFRFLPDQVEALVTLGKAEKARPLADWLERRGRELDRPWALATGGRCCALVRAAEGDLTGALAAVDEALLVHERLPMPFELARTWLVKGEIERRAKRKAAAKLSLERAVAIFDELGAPLWSRRARRELQRIGLRRAAGAELTEGERRVAELTASGLTNREVAAQLFMSPKTVEANLARAYRKLGIRSRAELGARLGAERAPAQT
jgi:DNA-binding CsgD family transcriptional regulator